MEPIGVHIASERQMRKRRDDLLADPLVAEMVPLIFEDDTADGCDGIIARDVPFVYVKSLPDLVDEFLEHHYK